LSFLSWAIPWVIHFPEGLQISEKIANGERKKKNAGLLAKVSGRFTIFRFTIYE
jgi:hypothetical protein